MTRRAEADASEGDVTSWAEDSVTERAEGGVTDWSEGGVTSWPAWELGLQDLLLTNDV